ncbi:MAG TPA: DMT family transporter, partial [Burkholderiaceae bacterium]|nr:DMT family transporter [Burkholderiaceae bacterium]
MASRRDPALASPRSAPGQDPGSSPGFAPTDPARRRRDGQGLMIAGGMLLGTIGIFVQEAGQDPATTVWFRCVFGLVALLAWGAARGRLRELTGLRGRALAAVAATGVFMVVNWALFFAAIPRCSIAVSTVVFHIQPFWLMAMGAWWLHERVAPVQWAAAGVALVGLALASGLVEHDAAWWAQRSSYATGLLMCLLGSLSYAGAGFIAKVEGERLGSFALSAGQCAVGALALAPWPFLHGLPPPGAPWAWLVGLGVLHTGLAYVILYAGMARLPTGRIAVLQFVYPATAVLVDWGVYGRALSPLQMLGVALIGGALWT